MVVTGLRLLARDSEVPRVLAWNSEVPGVLAWDSEVPRVLARDRVLLSSVMPRDKVVP